MGRRGGSKRKPKRRTLIVCEGKETEPNYLSQFRRRDDVTKYRQVTVVPGKGGSRQQVVHHAFKCSKRAKFDEVFCVLDTERQDCPETRDDIKRAIDLANANDVQLFWSNPCFEVWLIAHFQRTSRTFHDGEATCNYLDRLMNDRFQVAYAKSDPDVYSRLRSLIDEAKMNAHDVRYYDHGEDASVLDCNSSTEIDRLCTILTKPLG